MNHASAGLRSAGLRSELKARIRGDGIEIVHAHNLFPALGPGVIRTAFTEGTAVVLTLHNYRLMCIAGTFFRDGRICQDCFGHQPWPGVLHACYRGSRAQSAVVGAANAPGAETDLRNDGFRAAE